MLVRLPKKATIIKFLLIAIFVLVGGFLFFHGVNAEPTTATTATNTASGASNASASVGKSITNFVGDTVFDWIVGGFKYIVGMMAMFIISIVGGFLMQMIGWLMLLAQYNGFINSPIVSMGWVVVRDICNMFFVLILLIIAISTILGYEEYQFKKLLPNFIIMAVLINFSKMICGIFIDFAQVIMLTFVSAFQDAGAGNILVALNIPMLEKLYVATGEAPIFGGVVAAATTQVPPDIMSINTTMIVACIYLIIACVVIGVMMFMLLYRIVALWILVILSPAAYLLSTFPAGQRYASQWWSEFTNNLIVGPVMAFFLWLSLSVVQILNPGITDVGKAIPLSAALGFDASQWDKLPAVGAAIAGQPGNFMGFLIAICLLLGSLIAAQQIGAAGSKMAGAAMGKIQSSLAGFVASPFKLSFGAAGWAAKQVALTSARKLHEFAQDEEATGGRAFMKGFAKVVLAPTAGVRYVKAFMNREEEKRKETVHLAEAIAKDRVAKTPLINEPAIYKDQAEAAEEGKWAKDFSHMTRSQVVDTARKLYGKKDLQSQKMRRGLLRHAMANGWTDDVLTDDEMLKNDKYINAAGLNPKTDDLYSHDSKIRLMTAYFGGHVVETDETDEDGNVVMEKYEENGETKERAKRVHKVHGVGESDLRAWGDLEEISKKANRFEGTGLVTQDKAGKWTTVSLEDSANKVLAEKDKINERQTMQQPNHNFLVMRQNEKGETVWVAPTMNNKSEYKSFVKIMAGKSGDFQTWVQARAGNFLGKFDGKDTLDLNDNGESIQRLKDVYSDIKTDDAKKNMVANLKNLMVKKNATKIKSYKNDGTYEEFDSIEKLLLGKEGMQQKTEEEVKQKTEEEAKKAQEKQEKDEEKNAAKNAYQIQQQILEELKKFNEGKK